MITYSKEVFKGKFYFCKQWNKPLLVCDYIFIADFFFFCKCVITIFLIGKSCRLHALLGINNWYCYNDYHCVGNWFDCWLFSTSWTCIHDIKKRKQKWHIYIPLYCLCTGVFFMYFITFFNPNFAQERIESFP